MKLVYLLTDDPYHDNEVFYAAFTDRAKADEAAAVGWPGATVHEVDLDPEVKPARVFHFVCLEDQNYGEQKKIVTRHTDTFYNGTEPDETHAFWGGGPGSNYACTIRRGWGLTPEAAAEDCARRHGTFTITDKEWK